MTVCPVDEERAAELERLVEKAAHARRLARDMTDPDVRRSFIEWALQSEARIAEIRTGGPVRNP